ncbi:MAG: HAMP domain-containing protein [Oscillospiraceae bacterium]|nr:HAMP domain-containing protein [Oscillospiraceae bacterium]MBQ6901385.1 HAMP domain-containing protein [Oscillospiraceae bacterium]
MRSLQMKLVLVLVLLIVSVMAIVGTFMLNQVSVYYFNDFTEQMNSVFNAEVFAMLKTEAQAEGGAERLNTAVEAYSQAMRISSYRNYYILDGKTGATLFGSNDDEVIRTPAVISALGGKIGQEKRVSSGYIDRANPIVVDGEVKYIVYVKDTKQDQQSLTASMFTIILRTMMFALLIAVFLSFLFAKTITTPIENITKGAKKLSMGELDTTLAVSSNDEIGTLTEAFNDMASALNTTLAKVEDERNKLDTMFLYMTDGVTAFSRSGELVHHNPAAVEMLGFDEKTDKTYDAIFKDSGIELSSLFEMEGSFEEYSLTHGEKTLKVSFALFGNEAEDSGVIAIIHDFTAQQKLENSRREFVANVSHELRTPLTNVKSYTETLAESPDAPDEMKKQFFGVILNETDRMTRIVKDLLTLSRLDSAKMDWKNETFSLKKSVENAYRAMEMEARRNGHKLTMSVDASLPSFFGDRERIEQVFINLLSNAVKYTPEGGRIDFSAENYDSFIKITVKDNGIGIPEKDMPRLFERFYRVDKARSREMGGTGLGLAIAKEIVEHHGGEIRLESKYGSGTTVSVILPKDEAGEAI